MTTDATIAVAMGTGVSISGQHLDHVHAVFTRWFGKEYDLEALDCVLSAAAAQKLAGDPCWMLVVSGSGAAKTETVMPLTAIPGTHVTSTITGEAALLSGTAEKERAKNATGGLLREIGEDGLLVIKDVTSILSMNRDARAAVLASLREVYDGCWVRQVGADGGRRLTWRGRLTVIGAVTTAWDAAHAVISVMGDRFVLVRFDSAAPRSRRAAARQALANVGHEREMRENLGEAVANLFKNIGPDAESMLTDADTEELFGLADVVTLARTAVERDYSGNVVQAHAPEMPTRFAKQLAQIVRGGRAIGKASGDALLLAVRCARDTMPPLRLTVLADVHAHPGSSTAAVVRRVQLPRSTVDRALQELHLLGVLSVEKAPYGQGVQWLYSLSPAMDFRSVQRLSRNGDPHPNAMQPHLRTGPA
ncbi:MarR family transcriptional regulator [Streptomyces sp. BI20]|uniref:MarR family transcriptional regulator n=1 Tax=Streptomyces sp. BI20 TaxID=3403460 RepID=UPI003C74788F